MGYIYRITNKINNMKYIGQTIGDLNERFRHHCNKRSNCRYLKNALQKYGKHNFKFELICVCFDSDCDIYEKQYIEKYNTIVPNGYNLREGGQSGRQNDETKQKISEGLKKGYAEGRIKSPCGSLGKKLTDEHKKKISDKIKGTIHGSKMREKLRKANLKYKVQQYSLEGILLNEYNGIVEAANAVSSTKSQISSACRGKVKTSSGFIWKYVKI